MLMTANTTSFQIDTAPAAWIMTCGHGLNRESLLGSVNALAARCAY
jgi:hypothetical protein